MQPQGTARPRSRVLPALLAALLFSLFALGSARPSDVGQLAALEADPCAEIDVKRQRDHVRSFRSESGLPASKAVVDRSLIDLIFRKADPVYGVPLAPEEYRYLAHGQALVAAAPAVDDYGEKRAPDSYAGYYINFERGGSVRAGFTEDGARHLANLRRTFAYPNRLKAFRARHTIRELDAAYERVLMDLDRLDTLGVEVLGLSTSVEHNALETVASRPRRAKEILERRYGVRFLVHDAGVPSNKFRPPRVTVTSLGVRTGALPQYCGSGEPCSLLQLASAIARRPLPVRKGADITIDVRVPARAVAFEPERRPAWPARKLTDDGKVWAVRVPCDVGAGKSVRLEIEYRGGYGNVVLELRPAGSTETSTR